MKSIIKLITILLLLLADTNHLKAGVNGKAEIWFKVYDYDDSTAWSTPITIYKQIGNDYQYFSYSLTYGDFEHEHNCNAWADIDETNAGSNSLPPFSYNSTYAVVIDNKFIIMHIGAHTTSPDVEILFNRSTRRFAFGDNYGGIVSFEGTTNFWNYYATVKNSFNNGSVIIDQITYTNIGAGSIQTWPHINFNHNLEAFDEQIHSNYTMKFNGWFDKVNSLINSNKIINVSLPDEETITFNASFNEYSRLTINNYIIGRGNIGSVTVGGITMSAPATKEVLRDGSAIVEVTGFTDQGIHYTLDHWSDGSTSSYRTIYPNGNISYTIYYIGRPVNTPMNVTINSSEIGQPVRLNWNIHPSTGVTQYRVYRGAKVEGNFTNPIIIATLDKNVTSFTDGSYIIGGSNPNSVAYDVVPYYATEDRWGYVGMNVVSATPDLSARVNSNSTQVVMEPEIDEPINFNIDNYPNPFNPTTTINYQIQQDGLVIIKVYDMLGKEVETLVNEYKSGGSYQIGFDGSKLTSGIYFAAIQSNKFTKTIKLLLTK